MTPRRRIEVEAELLDKCESLARMPGQGHRRTDYTKANVLFFPVYSYLIAYRPGTDPAPDPRHCAWYPPGEEDPKRERGLKCESKEKTKNTGRCI